MGHAVAFTAGINENLFLDRDDIIELLEKLYIQSNTEDAVIIVNSVCPVSYKTSGEKAETSGIYIEAQRGGMPIAYQFMPGLPNGDSDTPKILYGKNHDGWEILGLWKNQDTNGHEDIGHLVTTDPLNAGIEESLQPAQLRDINKSSLRYHPTNNSQ